MKKLLLSFMLCFVFFAGSVNAEKEVFTITNGFIPDRCFYLCDSSFTEYCLDCEIFLDWATDILDKFGFQNITNVEIDVIYKDSDPHTLTRYVSKVRLIIHTED